MTTPEQFIEIIDPVALDEKKKIEENQARDRKQFESPPPAEPQPPDQAPPPQQDQQPADQNREKNDQNQPDDKNTKDSGAGGDATSPSRPEPTVKRPVPTRGQEQLATPATSRISRTRQETSRRQMIPSFAS